MLHAVRLAGFATTPAIVDRVDLAADVVDETLRGLDGQHLIEHMTFADLGGWILTDTGKARDAAMLREEREASGAGSVLHATIEEFESGPNPRLVRAITDWQRRSATDHPGERAAVVRDLSEVEEALGDLMAGPVDRLPRFGRYPRQFSAALEKARAGEEQWVAGIGLLSCHIVWAELHEDLLFSAGRDRSTEPRQTGR